MRERVRRLLFVVLVGAALHPACGPADTTIRASDFDQRCVVDSDCVSVEDGDVCEPCGPSHPAAVVWSASSAFSARESALQSNCSRGCQSYDCMFSNNGDTPFCRRGTCASCPRGTGMDCPPDASIELHDGGIAPIDASDAAFDAQD
jgi:hypothetical protein